MDIALFVAMSLAIILTESPTYDFECGYYIDDILIHEGTPRHGGTWWGYASYDKVIIASGLNETNRMMVFAHESFHQSRMRAGTFNKWNMREEERLAQEYGWNQSNWDSRINRFHCVEE